MPKDRKYLDLITKNTNSRISDFKFSVEDALFEIMHPGITLGSKDAMFQPEPYRTVKSKKQMYNELLPIDKNLKIFGGKGLEKSAVADATTAGTESLSGGFTTGDWIGMASTVAGGISEIMNTISAAKATKQPVNNFLGFNEKALQVNKKAQMESEMNEQVAKRETERQLKLKSNTLKSRLRGSSTSLSGLKATDLATDYQIMEATTSANNQLEDTYGKQMLQLLGQEQGLLTQKDQMEMSAAERMDEKIQQNMDNFYTNMATNIAGMSEAGQKLGQDFNAAKYREDFLNILPMTNSWGIGIDYQNGVPSMYSSKRNRTIVEQGV